jgi:hypothetical protein
MNDYKTKIVERPDAMFIEESRTVDLSLSGDIIEQSEWVTAPKVEAEAEILIPFEKPGKLPRSKRGISGYQTKRQIIIYSYYIVTAVQYLEP